MNKMKKISIVWGLFAVFIVGLLTLFGFLYKSKVGVYKDLEEQLVSASKKYIEAKFLYPKENEEFKATSSELVESGFMEELKVNDEVCHGYVVVSKSTVFNYKGYVECKNYKTKGYKS